MKCFIMLKFIKNTNESSLLFFVATYDSCALVGQCPLLCNVGNTLGSEMPPVRYDDVSNICVI